MSNLKARIAKLYSGSISDVTGRFTILKDDKIIRRVSHGTNNTKVIEIVIRL